MREEMFSSAAKSFLKFKRVSKLLISIKVRLVVKIEQAGYLDYHYRFYDILVLLNMQIPDL